MVQFRYCSCIVREEKKIPLSFSPAIHYFAVSGLSGQEMLPDFASRMLKNAYNKNVTPINIFVTIIDLQRFIYNFAIWILKR